MWKLSTVTFDRYITKVYFKVIQILHMTYGILTSHLYNNLPIAERVFVRCIGEELGRSPELLKSLGRFVSKNLRCCSLINVEDCAEDRRLEVCLEYIMLGVWLKCFAISDVEKMANVSLSLTR